MVKKSFNNCYKEAVKNHEKNANSKMYQVAGYIGKVEKTIDPRWVKLPPNVWSHYVVVTSSGEVLDPTAKQFGETQKIKYPFSTLKRKWSKIYELNV